MRWAGFRDFVGSDSIAILATIVAVPATYVLTSDTITSGTAAYYGIGFVLTVWLCLVCYNLLRRSVDDVPRLVLVELIALVGTLIVYVAVPPRFEGGIMTEMVAALSGLLILLIPVSVVLWSLKKIWNKFGPRSVQLALSN